MLTKPWKVTEVNLRHYWHEERIRQCECIEDNLDPPHLVPAK